MTSSLNIGWAETDITPSGKVELFGQYYQRVADEIESRLGATALVLENESDLAIMVSVDIAGIFNDFEKELQEKIKKDIPEIDSAKVFLNAIHTHNAPGTFDWKGWWEPDSEAVTTAEYHDFLIDKLSKLIAEAWENKEPAGIAPAFASARVGHCRAAMYADGTSEMYGDTARVDFIGLEGSEDSGVE
ncbi:MAG: neutral/alkaline non-lysosomal ceramidase N-terminal domain-containing protein, partial [Planctomycetota bacterium]